MQRSFPKLVLTALLACSVTGTSLEWLSPTPLKSNETTSSNSNVPKSHCPQKNIFTGISYPTKLPLTEYVTNGGRLSEGLRGTLSLQPIPITPPTSPTHLETSTALGGQSTLCGITSRLRDRVGSGRCGILRTSLTRLRNHLTGSDFRCVPILPLFQVPGPQDGTSVTPSTPMLKETCSCGSTSWSWPTGTPRIQPLDGDSHIRSFSDRSSIRTLSTPLDGGYECDGFKCWKK